MNALSNLKSLVTLASLVAASSALTGCLVLGDPMGDDDGITITDDSCVSTCEYRNDNCGLDFQVNCQELCDTIHEVECDGELDDLNACRDSEGDVCEETPAACKAEEDAFVACLDAAAEENGVQ